MLNTKLPLLLCAIYLLPTLAWGQVSKNMTKLGELGYTEDLSDVWGYVDGQGNEYALVGVYNGLSIVDVTDPVNPIKVVFEPGPNSIWRDMKVWGDYAYVTNEQDSGLLVVNLQYLPDSIQTHYWKGSGSVHFSSAHNIFIDEQGYGYIVGADYGVGGAIVVDLFTTPGTPILKTVYNINYIHDCFVRGDTLWASEIYKGWFSVVDMSDKSQATIPQSKVMATQNTPYNFTHNCWLSDDGKYLYTTDEKSNAFVAGYDVSDLGNIEETDRLRSNPGSGVIPHNTFFINDYLVTAYYRDGVTVVDAARPHNLIETGHYDSSPMAGNGFNGDWGVYPYLPSGHVLVSDIEGGLFILGSDYTRACYLEGTVTDTVTMNPINGANVQIVSTSATDQTDFIGQYATGLADSGSYTVTFSKTGYRSKTITGVNLDNGVVTQLNVALKPLIPVAITGQVIDSVSGQGVPFAQVAFITGDTSYYITCDNQGLFSASVYTDNYSIYAGAWGHRTKGWPAQTVNGQTPPFTLEITKGYYDDFLFDFGWTEVSNASTGQWVRDVPIETSSGVIIANPGSDITGDFGKQCYVTGNGGGGVGDDDVDNGVTTLESPVFDLSIEPDPFLKLDWWFFDGFGSGTPNDYFELHLTNGIDTTVILHVGSTDPNMSQWNEEYIRVTEYLTPTANMKLQAIAVDFNPGHVVEAGLDGFEVIPGAELFPSVGFSSDVFDGCMPLTVQFTNESQNFTTFKWVLEGTDSVDYFAMDPMVTYDTTGKYDVKLIAENQFGEDSVVTMGYIEVFQRPNITAIVTFASSQTSSDGGFAITPIDGNPPYSYNWSYPGIGDTNVATILPVGDYSVTISNGLGCSKTIDFHIDFTSGIAGESEFISAEITPNPFSRSLHVSLELRDKGQLRVMNVAGQVLQQLELKPGANQLTLTDFPSAGMYFIEIQSGVQRLAKPVIYQP